MKYKDFLKERNLQDSKESVKLYHETFGQNVTRFIYNEFLEKVKQKVGEERFSLFLIKKAELKRHDLEVLHILKLIEYQDQVRLFIDIARDYAIDSEDGYNVPFNIKEIRGNRIIADKGIITVIPEYTGDQKNYIWSFSKFNIVKREIEAKLSKIDLKAKINDFSDIVKIAINAGASDIHMRPKGDFYYTFFRVSKEFEMQSELTMSLSDGKRIVQGLKTYAQRFTKGNFNSSISTQVQDARAEYPNLGVGLRIVFIPSPDLTNEALVARILQKTSALRPLNVLGYLEDDIAVFKDAASRKGGIFIVSGITNSGKNTFVTSLLGSIKDRNIVSVEDPIEYYLTNYNAQQFQVVETDIKEIKATFADFAKGFKRADPDIVYIGEWRNESELVNIIQELSFAGQLIFSTVHFSSAFSFFENTRDIFNINYNAAVNMLIISVNQVLVRKLCPYCSIPVLAKDVKIDELVLRALPFAVKEPIYEFLRSDNNIRAHNPDGCEFCKNTGYSGLTPVYEYFYPDIELKEWLRRENPTPFEIEKRVIERKIGKNKLEVLIEKIKNHEVGLDALSYLR